MSYANSICHKLQLSARDMLRAAVTAETITLIASASILAGIGEDDLMLPKVVCLCQRAAGEPGAYDGNYIAELAVKVSMSKADNTADEFHALCGEVFAHFELAHTDVETNLSNATYEFTAFTVFTGEQSWTFLQGADGNNSGWEGVLNLQVKCCGKVVS